MKKICFIGLFWIGHGITHAQTAVQRLDSLFSAPGNFESLNGSVLIAEQGKVIYERSFGFADMGNKRPNTSRSSFNIGSTTKTFTSTAVLQLLEKGKLHLDDPYQQYLPSFPYPNITIRHLLTQSSGLTDLETYFRILDSLPGKIFINADIIPSIIHLHRPLRFTPGDQFEYCNINFELLALLIEHITRMSYPAYISRYIFKPAGMSHTYFASFPPTVDSNLVINYMYPTLYASDHIPADSVKGLRLKQLMHNLKGLTGDGNTISTEEDLLRYDEALYANRLLQAATLQLAFQPHRLNNNKDYNFLGDLRLDKQQYGLGWIINIDSSNGKIVSHGGHYPGVWTNFIRNIGKHQTVIIYDNNDWSGAVLLSMMALEILNDRPVVNVLSKRMLARVYGQALVKDDANVALAKLITLKDDTVHYVLRERDLNNLGYQLLGDGSAQKSAEVFKVTVLLFPASANAYDSYGDALKALGQKDVAKEMYRKSLAVDPKNVESKAKLEKLEKDDNK